METPLGLVEAAYRAHGAALQGYLRGFVSGGEGAEDLLQETFVQALRHSERMAEAVSVRAWLFGVARHVALTHVRRVPRMRSLPEDVTARAEAVGDERVEAMRAAMRRLPDGQREALELRLRDELSYQEIAQVLAIPVGTVRSRLHHAMRTLKEELANTTSDEWRHDD